MKSYNIYKMKKSILILLVIMVLAAVCLIRFSAKKSAVPSAVVTSGYVPYTLVKQIGGGLLPVEMLLPPGAEPHSFEPSPGSMVAVHNARAFVYVSDALEPWAKDVLGAVGKKTRVVNLSQAVAPSQDPHVWMDFGAVVDMARALEKALSEMDPDNASIYEKNLKQFEQEVAVLDMDFARALSSCESREVVHIGHLAFGALAKRYHLSLMALAGTSHDGEHSAQKLIDLTKHIRAKHIQSLFTEEAVSPRLAQTVAAETGAQIFPLYTIEDISKDDFSNGVTYAQLMRRNLDSLQQGLVCKK